MAGPDFETDVNEKIGLMVTFGLLRAGGVEIDAIKRMALVHGPAFSNLSDCLINELRLPSGIVPLSSSWPWLGLVRQVDECLSDRCVTKERVGVAVDMIPEKTVFDGRSDNGLIMAALDAGVAVTSAGRVRFLAELGERGSLLKAKFDRRGLRVDLGGREAFVVGCAGSDDPGMKLSLEHISPLSLWRTRGPRYPIISSPTL